MHIFNIRSGFATNSSSTHSVLELPTEEIKKGIYTDEYMSFGWEFFTAADIESKENYFASTISLNLSMLGYKQNQINSYIKELFGEAMVSKVQNIGIDHQSVITLPTSWDGKTLNKEFIKEMLDYVRQENVVVLGGNDNTEDDHPLSDQGKASAISNLPVDTIGNHMVARKEKDYWTTFNRERGNKLRFSFFSEVAPEKSIAPELADIKITDFCPYACNFCYQDSTLKGQHASMDNIIKIADELAKAKVFECAMGGGETTLHPNFVEILKVFKERNIIPNFTTRNFNLLRQSNAKQILEHCGGMAFSVQSLDDMLKVKSSFLDSEDKEKMESTSYAYILEPKRSSIWNPKITFQVVMGTMPMKEFKEMLMMASTFGSRITLLGYKENGRGSSFAPHDYSDWLNVVSEIKKNNRLRVSIDTALASEYETQLLDKGVKENTFHTIEGTFSTYIDATKMTIAPSSYVGLEQTQTFDENWLEKYQTMRAKPEYRKTIKIKS